MNEAVKRLQEVISSWQKKRRYTYQNKGIVFFAQNPAIPGEYILHFGNSVYSFFCNDKLIPINLVSKPFLTRTLSDNPLSENPMADKDALEKLLDKFDNDFYDEVESKLNDCVDKLTVSDPLFF
jgi:hypothetical protein